ncbi:hypothetical protein FNH22_16870 [Fulvivirga sp. M361]|uniref:hypothetical protein n=1 Tax=Fulvivirga sp. M361 TaxID=2594266 RepID=UPI00117ACD2E|nr:hypothetical protein [Fulvivirga sp. M361]TRX56050.1 hypothetical protein FNH22_16870 [Fulvivirga sp. M361]
MMKSAQFLKDSMKKPVMVYNACIPDTDQVLLSMYESSDIIARGIGEDQGRCGVKRCFSS